MASATEIALSDNDCYQDVETILDLIHSGTMIISHVNDPSKYQVFKITGYTDATGYTRILIDHLYTGGSYAPAEAETCKLVFYPHILGTVYKTKSFTFDYSVVTGQGKPTLVAQGAFQGFSLPIYSSDNEELFTCDCMPEDWDGVTDPVIKVGGWLDTANNTKKFNLQVSVETASFSANAVVPATTNDYTDETTTDNWAQYTSFVSSFTLDADAIGLAAGEPVTIRIRRLAASGDEITGEVVIMGAALRYAVDKNGPTS